MTGFVSFVGAGPGDHELLTLKALARLEAADVVLFDDLAAGPTLDRVRPGAIQVDLAGGVAGGVRFAPALILYGPLLEEA
ncbi:MAG: SAM-dependent methyltransferase [Sphingobium sp.]